MTDEALFYSIGNCVPWTQLNHARKGSPLWRSVNRTGVKVLDEIFSNSSLPECRTEIA